MKTNLLIDGTKNKVIAVEQEGCSAPVDYSFESINDYVHCADPMYEELQGLCLGMATYIENIKSLIKKEADYCLEHYEKHKENDFERANRHLNRYQSLINIYNLPESL